MEKGGIEKNCDPDGIAVFHFYIISHISEGAESYVSEPYPKRAESDEEDY